VSSSNTRALSKTALGAEATVRVLHTRDTTSAILEARSHGFKIIVLEQSERSLNLYQFAPQDPIALVVGNEVDGVPEEILDLADTILELPMLGAKESLNVATAAGIALYQLRFAV
jgi:23S rRNA (guanosine2251-2'-O)-methyltransferase